MELLRGLGGTKALPGRWRRVRVASASAARVASHGPVDAAERALPLVAPQAYEVLSDDDMRRKYDAGEDVTGNPGEGEQQQQQGHWMHHGGQHVHVHFR